MPMPSEASSGASNQPAKDFSKDFKIAFVQSSKDRRMAEQGDEQEWICRSRNGDPEAFAELVGRYQRMIDALAYRMTGSQHDAADVTQEVFVQAYRRLDGFQERSKFSSWLYRIAVNTCLNWRQAEARRSEQQARWAAERVTSSDDSETTQADISRRVQSALLQLSAKQRAAIVLTIYDGLTHAEAAKALDCSETTVSWRLFAARRKLKRLLKKPFTPTPHE